MCTDNSQTILRQLPYLCVGSLNGYPLSNHVSARCVSPPTSIKYDDDFVASQPPVQRITILSHLGGHAVEPRIDTLWHSCGRYSSKQGQGVDHSLRYRLRHFCICLSQHSVFSNTTIMGIQTFTEGECSLGTKFKRFFLI
jgi:hypothetical protein